MCEIYVEVKIKHQAPQHKSLIFRAFHVIICTCCSVSIIKIIAYILLAHRTRLTADYLTFFSFSFERFFNSDTICRWHSLGHLGLSWNPM
jgi:hypothetical protein